MFDMFREINLILEAKINICVHIGGLYLILEVRIVQKIVAFSTEY